MLLKVKWHELAAGIRLHTVFPFPKKHVSEAVFSFKNFSERGWQPRLWKRQLEFSGRQPRLWKRPVAS